MFSLPACCIHNVFICANNYFSGVSMVLSSSSLSVAEGNTGTSILPLCVQLQNIMTGLDRSVPLLLNTAFGTAGTGALFL